jgi:hypothetical protein
MIASRVWPSAAAPSTIAPVSSGPRWCSAAIIARTIASGHEFAGSVPGRDDTPARRLTTPAMPHMIDGFR